MKATSAMRSHTASALLVLGLLISPWARAEELTSVRLEVPVTEVSASSVFDALQPAANLTNKSGMAGGRHDANSGAVTMWHTTLGPASSAPAASLPAAPAWVRFDFGGARSISEIDVWNHNQAGYTSRGFKTTRIYGTNDGKRWFPLSPATVDLAVGGERASAIKLDRAVPLTGVILAAETNHGGGLFRPERSRVL